MTFWGEKSSGLNNNSLDKSLVCLLLLQNITLLLEHCLSPSNLLWSKPRKHNFWLKLVLQNNNHVDNSLLYCYKHSNELHKKSCIMEVRDWGLRTFAWLSMNMNMPIKWQMWSAESGLYNLLQMRTWQVILNTRWLRRVAGAGRWRWWPHPQFPGGVDHWSHWSRLVTSQSTSASPTLNSWQ